MNWKATWHGILFGFKVAGKLVALGVVSGKAKTVIETGEKVIQAIDEAKASPPAA